MSLTSIVKVITNPSSAWTTIQPPAGDPVWIIKRVWTSSTYYGIRLGYGSAYNRGLLMISSGTSGMAVAATTKLLVTNTAPLSYEAPNTSAQLMYYALKGAPGISTSEQKPTIAAGATWTYQPSSPQLLTLLTGMNAPYMRMNGLAMEPTQNSFNFMPNGLVVDNNPNVLLQLDNSGGTSSVTMATPIAFLVAPGIPNAHVGSGTAAGSATVSITPAAGIAWTVEMQDSYITTTGGSGLQFTDPAGTMSSQTIWAIGKEPGILATAGNGVYYYNVYTSSVPYAYRALPIAN